MACEMVKKSRDRLTRERDRPLTDGELYLTHLLGSAGASRLLKLVAEKPQESAPKAFRAAAKANKNLFCVAEQKQRKASTVAEVHGRISAIMEGRVTQYATPQNLIRGLIAEFQASAEFRELSAKTRKDYGRYLGLIGDQFGDMPLAAAEDRRARGEFKSWRYRLQASPRAADYAWSVLARLFSWAKDRGRIINNPCERGGRSYRAYPSGEGRGKFKGRDVIAAFKPPDRPW